MPEQVFLQAAGAADSRPYKIQGIFPNLRRGWTPAGPPGNGPRLRTGGPVCRPYRKGAAYGGRVRTPAPTRIQGRPHSSRRGRSQTGPVCRPCIIPELSRGAPWGSRRDTDWDLGAPPHPIPVWPQGEGLRVTTWGRPYGGKRTEGVGSAKVGAEGEPHQKQILHTQGPVARRGFRVSLRFCAPEGFCLLQGITPVMGDRG